MTFDEDEIGSLSEEAYKLFAALSNGHVASESADHTTAEHPSTCQWCPVCRIVNSLRDNPEAVERVTASAAAFASSLRSFVDTLANPQSEDDL